MLACELCVYTHKQAQTVLISKLLLPMVKQQTVHKMRVIIQPKSIEHRRRQLTHYTTPMTVTEIRVGVRMEVLKPTES